MTFHPIERPTEPGWYWYRTPSLEVGAFDFWMYHVAMIEDYDSDDNLVETLMVDEGDGCDIDTYPGQWYGPAIPEPSVAGKPSSFENDTYH